jgi:hypothetical protein
VKTRRHSLQFFEPVRGENTVMEYGFSYTGDEDCPKLQCVMCVGKYYPMAA